jgi:hypothetical protein
LFDEYGTLSEFNGGTYAGVTLFAMSLAQYLPTNTTLYKHAPRLMSAIWDQVGESEQCGALRQLRKASIRGILADTAHSAETYNPSLTTLSGPWDRTYGFDLTQVSDFAASRRRYVDVGSSKTPPLSRGSTTASSVQRLRESSACLETVCNSYSTPARIVLHSYSTRTDR